MNVLHMEGNPCPIPVIGAKKELSLPESQGVIVIVDNIVAVQNLEKMAKGMGFSFSHQDLEDGLFQATIAKEGQTMMEEETVCQECQPMVVPDGATVLISANHMGRGSEELGKLLIKGFIFSLTQLPTRPKTLLFLNSGVELTCADSNALADLKTLESQGTKIISCGTCLNYYSLTDQLAVGEIGDMFLIASHLSTAIPLISL